MSMKTGFPKKKIDTRPCPYGVRLEEQTHLDMEFAKDHDYDIPECSRVALAEYYAKLRKKIEADMEKGEVAS